jgi:hypothetical protein
VRFYACSLAAHTISCCCQQMHNSGNTRHSCAKLYEIVLHERYLTHKISLFTGFMFKAISDILEWRCKYQLAELFFNIMSYQSPNTYSTLRNVKNWYIPKCTPVPYLQVKLIHCQFLIILDTLGKKQRKLQQSSTSARNALISRG